MVNSTSIPFEDEAKVVSAQLVEAESRNEALLSKIKELEARCMRVETKSPVKSVEPSETSKVSLLLEQTLDRMNALEQQLKEKEEVKSRETHKHTPKPPPSAHVSEDENDEESGDADGSEYDGEEYITTPGGQTVP